MIFNSSIRRYGSLNKNFVYSNKCNFASLINFYEENKKKRKITGPKSKDKEVTKKLENEELAPMKAIKVLKELNEKGTISMLVKLGINPSKGDQQVRGMCKFPGGAVKLPRICVFTTGHFIEVAKEAGADIIGNEDTINMIKTAETYNFDKLICTLDMLPSLKQLGRILGPKGLMPNQKVGTASKGEDLESIIKEMKSGSKEFKMDTGGQVKIPIATLDFDTENIYKNIDSFIRILFEKKPDSAKPLYIEKAFFSIRKQKKPIYLDVKYLDLKSPNYFINKV